MKEELTYVFVTEFGTSFAAVGKEDGDFCDFEFSAYGCV